MTYRVLRPPILETLNVRGLRFQLYRWPGADPRPRLFAHGWGDSGETFQFVIDRLSPRFTVVAFDARGFGRTQWPEDGYWFPDYLADLDALIDAISPDEPIDLIGHSMGGNVAMLYAGVRTQRVRRLINLEGFGLPPTTPDQAPGRYREWLDEVKHGMKFATYEDFDRFAAVLARRHPRTPPEHLAFIARSWARQTENGRIELRSDPRHKRVNPVLYQREQAEACWRAILAPVLFVVGGRSELATQFSEAGSVVKFTHTFRDLTLRTLHDAGHMMHHERPSAVAELIEEFFR